MASYLPPENRIEYTLVVLGCQEVNYWGCNSYDHQENMQTSDIQDKKGGFGVK